MIVLLVMSAFTLSVDKEFHMHAACCNGCYWAFSVSLEFLCRQAESDDQDNFCSISVMLMDVQSVIAVVAAEHFASPTDPAP